MKNLLLTGALALTASFLSFTFSSCQENVDSEKSATEEKTNLFKDGGAQVEISTELGVMVVRLYDETPKHKENFLKLAREGFYDGTLFHRVMAKFMIQGGDPKSREAGPEENLGSGGPGYTIDAEFVSGLIHKKGALAAARTPDHVNPTRASSGSQFYIVQGDLVTRETVLNMQNQRKDQRRKKLFQQVLMMPEQKENLELYKKFYEAQDEQGHLDMVEKLAPLLDSLLTAMGSFSYTEEQLNAYATIGGAPNLDEDYTVFGEIVSGMDVLDKIAAVQTGNADRPTKDITMKVRIISE